MDVFNLEVWSTLERHRIVFHLKTAPESRFEASGRWSGISGSAGANGAWRLLFSLLFFFWWGFSSGRGGVPLIPSFSLRLARHSFALVNGFVSWDNALASEKRLLSSTMTTVLLHSAQCERVHRSKRLPPSVLEQVAASSYKKKEIINRSSELADSLCVSHVGIVNQRTKNGSSFGRF